MHVYKPVMGNAFTRLHFCYLAIEDCEDTPVRFAMFSPNQRDITVTIPFQDDVNQFEVILPASPGVFIDSPARAVVSRGMLLLIIKHLITG